MVSNLKVLFVGNIMPMEIVNLLNLSVAGKKYEISLAKALNTLLGDNLKIVSLSKQGRREARRLKINEVFQGKCFIQTKTVNFPMISDLLRDTHFFLILLKWSLVNIRYKRVIVILNSPFGVCFSALIFKYFTGVKPVSLTIDTPFTKENSFKGFLGRYNRILFSGGYYLLKSFSGIVVQNRNAIDVLKLKIPSLITRIGFDETDYTDLNEVSINHESNPFPKRIIYAGTLIYYNGIPALLKAFSLLNRFEYELHIYGYGPMENEVQEFAQGSSNIYFHGRTTNQSILSILPTADLLINPRSTEDQVDLFGFPSKLVEYILSGRPVLTTRTRSIPNELEEFLFFIDVETPQGISKSIQDFFLKDANLVNEKTLNGLSYIRGNHNWTIITKELLTFLETI